jgi:CDP-alcohol phosphatidyltransferase
MTHSPRIALVNLVTLSGFALGLLGVYLLPSPTAGALLAASVALDATDGYIARKLDACTTLGARFDWCVDTCLSYAIAFRITPHDPIFGAVLVAWLVGVQSLALWKAWRFSGRTCITILSILYCLTSPIIKDHNMHNPLCNCSECTSSRLTGGLNAPPPSTGQMIESLLTEQYQGNGDTPLAAPPLGIPSQAIPMHDDMPTPEPGTAALNLCHYGPVCIPSGSACLLSTIPAQHDGFILQSIHLSSDAPDVCCRIFIGNDLVHGSTTVTGQPPTLIHTLPDMVPDTIGVPVAPGLTGRHIPAGRQLSILVINNYTQHAHVSGWCAVTPSDPQSPTPAPTPISN